MGWNENGLAIPSTKCKEILHSTCYQTQEDKKEALLRYYQSTMPIASWQHFAGALHARGEKTALEDVKKFLKDKTAG